MSAELASRVDRTVQFGLAASDMALRSSGLELGSEDPDRIGVIVGSGIGGLHDYEDALVGAVERGAHRINPAAVPRISPNAVSSQIGIRYGLRGTNLVIATACASGAHALGEAFRKIQYGDLDLALAGGAEAPLTLFNAGAYCALRVLSKRNDDPAGASRPFDLERDGFVLAEGAAMLVLEERGRALRRGAPIVAELVGYGSNSGAHHMVMPDPAGADAARVMALALKDAGLTSVDYINAHATSTRANDVAETRAIKTVFGDGAARIPVSSSKSMIGHSLGAAGALEAVICANAIADSFIPPTINLVHPDPDCDLDYVPLQGRAARLRTVLSNSFGFGNCNAALIFAEPS